MKRWPWLCLLIGGCAHLNFEPLTSPPGQIDGAVTTSDAADALGRRDAAEVRVVDGPLPPGLAWSPTGLVVQDPRYRIVGQVVALPKPGHLANLGLWFYDYPDDEAWRRGYCHWQVPLSWLTFTVWSWLNPLYYPCHVAENNLAPDIAGRRTRILATMQKATKALGGNLLVVTHLGDQMRIHDSMRFGLHISDKAMMNGEGIALYDFQRAMDRKAPPH